jgi:RHS repeat-associated protein
VENRLVAVTDTVTLSVTQFVYDGNGNRVLTIWPDGSKTAFPAASAGLRVGERYEVEEDLTRSYYRLGGQRIAMRLDDGETSEVYWLHTDHLGSTSLLSTISGTLVISSTTRFLPFGDYRVEPEAGLTDVGFTGHRQQDNVGLIFMRARFYMPYLNRFLQPDTIVPDPSNPQSLNRYSYVNNNPLRYTDPTGHCVEGSEDFEECMQWVDQIHNSWDTIFVEVCIGGGFIGGCQGWTAEEVQLLHDTLSEYTFSQYLEGDIWFYRTDSGDEGWGGLTRKFSFEDGEKYSLIGIANEAWTTPPAMGIHDLFDIVSTSDHFQGTIAHELTHAAVWFNPWLLDSWIENSDVGKGDLRLGLLYDWSIYDDFQDDEELYESLIQGELFAMATSALLYDRWWVRGR